MTKHSNSTVNPSGINAISPELFPFARDYNPAGSPSLPASTNAPKGTIEYNESISPNFSGPGLSAAQALNEALVHGPRAAAVRAQFAIARAGFASATQAPNPYFFFDRGLMAEQVNRMGPLLTSDAPWKLLFRLLIAKRTVAQTKIDLLTQIWSLRADARRAYAEVVVAQEAQRTLQQSYALAARLTGVAEKRFKAGAVPELDVIKARLASDQAEVDVNVGIKRVERAKQQLNLLMGRAVDAPLFVPNLPDASAPQVEQRLHATNDLLPNFSAALPALSEFSDRALANRLELRSLLLQAQVNNASLQGAYASILPNATFSYGKSTAGNPTAGPKLTALFMTLNAEMPISNINQGSIWQYRATRNQLKYQVLSQRNQVMADVSSAYNNLISARKRIRIYQQSLLADSAEVVRLARRSYESGQSDLTATLAAQQANIQIRNAYLDAVNAYASSFTDLEFAVGRPLQ